MIENYSGSGTGSVFQANLYIYLTVSNQPSAEYVKNMTDADSILVSLKSNQLNLAIADGIYSLMFLAFILQYQFISKRVTKSNLINNVTVGDYAIEIKGFPRKNIKTEKIQKLFSKYGDIVEIALGRVYNGRLDEYKKRAEISKKLGLKKLIARMQNNKRRVTINVLERKKLNFDEAINLEDDLADKTNDELPVDRVFIIFDRL